MANSLFVCVTTMVKDTLANSLFVYVTTVVKDTLANSLFVYVTTVVKDTLAERFGVERCGAKMTWSKAPGFPHLFRSEACGTVLTGPNLLI